MWHKNPFFLALVAVIGVVMLWFTGVALYKYYQYVTLSEKTTPTHIKWSVEEVDSDNFVIHALYNFSVGDQQRDGSYFFSEKYRNTWAAEQEIKRYITKSWNVWYQPGKEHHSALQKNFPTKECISAIILWALLFYFLWLGYYVSNYGK